MAGGSLFLFLVPKRSEAFLENGDWNICKDRPPCGSVYQSNGVPRNHSESLCQSTWSIDDKDAMNFSFGVLDSLKWTKFLMHRPMYIGGSPGVIVPV